MSCVTGTAGWPASSELRPPTHHACFAAAGLKKAEIDGRLEEAGIEMVYVFCVNDGAVMSAWKKDQGLAGSDLIEMVADNHAALTEALGLLLTGEDKAKIYPGLPPCPQASRAQESPTASRSRSHPHGSASTCALIHACSRAAPRLRPHALAPLLPPPLPACLVQSTR